MEIEAAVNRLVNREVRQSAEWRDDTTPEFKRLPGIRAFIENVGDGIVTVRLAYWQTRRTFGRIVVERDPDYDDLWIAKIPISDTALWWQACAAIESITKINVKREEPIKFELVW